MLIAEHDLRAEQVRSTRSTASQIGTMARAADAHVETFATLDYRRVAGWPLLRWKDPRVCAASLSVREHAGRYYHDADERRECILSHPSYLSRTWLSQLRYGQGPGLVNRNTPDRIDSTCFSKTEIAKYRVGETW
jgi:hypothetical protein